MRRPPVVVALADDQAPLGVEAQAVGPPGGLAEHRALSSGPSFIVRLRGVSSNSRNPSGLQAGPSLNFRSPTTFSQAAPGASSAGSFGSAVAGAAAGAGAGAGVCPSSVATSRAAFDVNIGRSIVQNEALRPTCNQWGAMGRAPNGRRAAMSAWLVKLRHSTYSSDEAGR